MNIKHSKERFVFIVALGVILSLFFISDAITSQSVKSEERVQYRTFFGQCPSRSAGSLTMELVSEFERHGSLRDVKERMTRDRLDEKHFITSYQIDYDPYARILYFRFECPAPLMKVQIYKNSGLDSYEAILVEGGKLYDPTYEVLLRAEDKLEYELPYLAIPMGGFDANLQQDISSLISQMGHELRKALAEVIVGREGELTMILSVNSTPSSVFFGEDHWESKMLKLEQIIGFMDREQRVPAIINLTNPKKVVVKFDDRP